MPHQQSHTSGHVDQNHDMQHKDHVGQKSLDSQAQHEGMDHDGHVAMDHSAHAAMNHGGHGSMDHSGHAGHSPDMFKRPFWISLILTIPILVYAELFQQLLGYTAPVFPGSQYIGFVLGSIIYWYGGWVFLSGAFDELRRRLPGMMTLVALAISTA